MQKMTVGSLFSGSGGFELAGLITGFTPVWKSEIKPFPIWVTNNNFPDALHFGDINKLNGADLPPVDCITGGSPCQDMSIAGKRSGLDGDRSCLFREQVRIVEEMRRQTNGRYPRFMVWENVPGAYSSNKGEDFRQVLEAIARIKDKSAYIPRPENRGGVGRTATVSWVTVSPSLGELLMPNTGEYPKDVRESTLSQILEETPHPKYYLSATACLGILRRAERRGKKLPDILREALENQARALS